MGAGLDPVADHSGVQAAIDRLTSTMDFWSIHDACVTITDTESTIALPAVTVADLPCCIVVTRANIMIKWRLTVNTNACNANNLIGDCTPALQVKCDGGCAWVDGHLIVACMLETASCSRESGDVWIGSICVQPTICGNDIYCFRFCQAEAAFNNLELKDMQTGIRVFYTPN